MIRRLTSVVLAVTIAGCGISTQQEVQIGQQNAAQINAQLPIVQDPEVNRYLSLLGDSIAKLTARGDLDWHFYLVNSEDFNAFAVPGGFIYINRGVVERSDQLDQMASVMGHEIGHVVRRHSVKQMEQMQGANIGVTIGCVLTGVCNNQAVAAGVNVAGSAVFAKFSRTDEAEADAEGIKNLVRAGIDPRGMTQMFEKLLEERKSKPSGLDAWFTDHPLEEDRIRATEQEIAKIDPAILATLTKDTKAFHAFKSRVLALPPPRGAR
jgi:predicted Zn-dependent protease